MATDGNQIVPLPTTGGEEPNPPPPSSVNSPKSKNARPKRKRQEKPQEKSFVKPLKSTLRSWVWNHFEKFKEPIFENINGKKQHVGHEQRAKCKYCSTDIKCDSTFNGTSALKRHIENVYKLYPGRADLEDGQQIFTSDGTSNPKVAMVQWTQEACVKAAAEMIVIDELPFSYIEKEGFRRFCSVAVPRFEDFVQ